ncbi:hypothetical protein CMV_027982 [Castanea mollissima]|uniref:Uncharacterized protein n=1 Tax=Castanea mollissima TaxID=60419 RepID=A0A8J4Q8K7_9ROSI|nr:hypothetical protein CMV_027982 [Castanea mollissima]
MFTASNGPYSASTATQKQITKPLQSKPRGRERRKRQRTKMTQKANLFKGQQKKKSVPPNRHGKPSVTRKGKRFVKPAKVTKEMDVDRELSKFINYCNEVKAATAANREGGQLSIVKPPPESTSGEKK